MPNQHRYRLMRPHSKLVDRLPGEYPESVNVALARYLQLISTPLGFSETEWNLLQDACNGWSSLNEPPDILSKGLALQVEDAINFRKLDKKWGIDASALVPRLYGLSEVEAIAVVHKIELLWQFGTNQSSSLEATPPTPGCDSHAPGHSPTPDATDYYDRTDLEVIAKGVILE